MTDSSSAGFPHSEISGSMRMCRSPELIAACRVLLRLLMPRHSPCALFRLIYWFSRIMQAPLPVFSSVEIVFTHVSTIASNFSAFCCLACLFSLCSVFNVQSRHTSYLNIPNRSPAQRVRFGKEEGANGYAVFAALTVTAETEWSWLLLTPYPLN